MKYILLFIFSLLLCPAVVDAQASKNHAKIGFITGWGGQLYPFIDVNYEHQVVFAQLQYFHSLVERKNMSIELLWQPQYNFTRYKLFDNRPDRTFGTEAGLNIGFLLAYRTKEDRLKAYILPSIGPHYISGGPKRQSPGFLFSDNILFGLQIKLAEAYWLDLRPGLRHISSAGLTKRNGGINHAILTAGFIWMVKKG
ncbi:MAG: acyloxyacyl hydrolase [Bacteroidota bacterium]